MAVHIGQVTAEVTTSPRPPTAAEPTGQPESPWAEQARLATVLARVQREHERTATGDGHD